MKLINLQVMSLKIGRGPSLDWREEGSWLGNSVLNRCCKTEAGKCESDKEEWKLHIA